MVTSKKICNYLHHMNFGIWRQIAVYMDWKCLSLLLINSRKASHSDYTDMTCQFKEKEVVVQFKNNGDFKNLYSTIRWFGKERSLRRLGGSFHVFIFLLGLLLDMLTQPTRSFAIYSCTHCNCNLWGRWNTWKKNALLIY